jgi:hypothetical protein
MRGTRNKSRSHHHKPFVPRVQPLLKCAPSRSFGADWTDDAPATTSLNAACSWVAPSTAVSRSSTSTGGNQSHSSSSQSPHSLRTNPTEGERLVSHGCEAGLSQCHPRIARYHTATCQRLATPQ